MPDAHLGQSDACSTALFDADNHYYEPRDGFTRHMPAGARPRGPRARRDGNDDIFIGDEPFTFLRQQLRPTVGQPGALREMLRTMKTGDVGERPSVDEPMQPEYVEP